MDKQIFISLACIIAGLFSSICAGMDFDFFMNHRKARFFVKILGRNGARIFYVLLGIAMIIVGVGFFTGIIPLQGEPVFQ
jgi:small neutral amino acid transporter SnatA (MarC family)